jgi:hypothetical protein
MGISIPTAPPGALPPQLSVNTASFSLVQLATNNVAASIGVISDLKFM